MRLLELGEIRFDGEFINKFVVVVVVVVFITFIVI